MVAFSRRGQTAAFWATCLLLAASTLQAQGTGSVQGRVTDAEDGSPVRAALVELQAENGRTVARAETNGDGIYRISSVPAGSYSISISAVGYDTQRMQDVQVTAGGSSTADLAVQRRVIELVPITVTAGRQAEKVIDAPAHVEVIGETEIDNRPVTTPVDHLRTLASVDIITQGVQSTNVVVRGFNNIFSGALHTLTDNRIAGVPSLRVNVMSFVPSTNDDIQRMEVVLGPGAALYGPNTADGVLHIITKSPFDQQGTSLSLSGGERDLFSLSGRTAHQLSDNLGIKFSAHYLQAQEWPDIDPIEQSERQKIDADPAFWALDLEKAAGISRQEAESRLANVAQRDYDINRWTGDARVDWRVAEDATAIFSGGVSNAGSQIELTGLGAAQVEDWRYSYFQTRFNRRRLFAQAYLNSSNAGDTYLLRNGSPIVDRSKLWVAQLQHGFGLGGERQNFTYGVDYIFTTPETEGTINGAYEDEDETTEVGVYLQSQTQLTPKLDLVLAGRIDDHSALPDMIFSPRAALVFKPSQNQALRVTYNRAFSTPSSLNQFLDLGTAIPSAGAARLGYSVRVQGTGTEGFTFRQGDGSYLMRSPFTPAQLNGPTQLVPAAAAAYWQAAVNVVAAQAAGMGAPLDPTLVALLQSLQPTPAQISSNWFNTLGQTGSLASLALPDVDPIRESTSSTFEVGYRGTVNNQLLLATDVWFSRRENLVTPLTVSTPFVALNPQETGAFLAAELTARGMPAAQVQAIVQQLAPALAQVPLGVVSSPQMKSATGAQLLATYTNVDGSIDLWGVDVSATYLLTNEWTVTGSASFVNEDHFQTESGAASNQFVFLNAPKRKGALSLAYRSSGAGLNAELRGRHTAGFPASSGVYEGVGCVVPGVSEAESPCVDSFTLFDLNLGYRLPSMPAASVQLSVQNLLDDEYRSFPGVPVIGRMALLRLRYEF
jgi:outer membrane receptor for ferrienterochelin and colicins